MTVSWSRCCFDLSTWIFLTRAFALFLRLYWVEIGQHKPRLFAASDSDFWYCTVLLIYHTAAQPFSDFRLESLTPLLQEVHMDPTWLEFEVDLLLILYPAEIEAPGTPGVSHGTKIFGPNFFSHQPLMNLFHEFCGLVLLKMPKIKKKMLIFGHF